MCVCVCVCMCNFTPHCWFSLNYSETVKAVTLRIGNFVAFSNISTESYVTNLVSLSLISLQILGKTHAGGISDFQICGQSLVKVNCQSSRASGDIDMKLGPVTKHDKSSKTTSKNLTMISCRQIVTSLSFFGFIPQIGAIRKPDSWRIITLTVTFYLTKTGNRSKKSLIQLLHYRFE